MSAIEYFESRGGSSGNGNWNRTRRFTVTVDSSIPVEHQDPLADEALPPRGSGFATFPGVVVTGYTPAERLGLRSWRVDVNYGVPTTLTPTWGGQWQVSVSSSLESEKQDVTTLDSQQIEDDVVPEIVGPWHYVEVKPTDGGSREGEKYTAKSRVFNVATGEIDSIEKTLKRLPLRKREGMQVTPSVATLTLQRRFARQINYSVALSKTTMVNSDVFYGAQPGQLKFMSINVNPTIVHIVENPEGVGEVVSLNFQWRTNGHQHTIQHLYEDPDLPNLVSPILLEGKPVIESFSTYLETSFTSMLNEL